MYYRTGIVFKIGENVEWEHIIPQVAKDEDKIKIDEVITYLDEHFQKYYSLTQKEREELMTEHNLYILYCYLADYFYFNNSFLEVHNELRDDIVYVINNYFESRKDNKKKLTLLRCLENIKDYSIKLLHEEKEKYECSIIKSKYKNKHSAELRNQIKNITFDATMGNFIEIVMPLEMLPIYLEINETLDYDNKNFYRTYLGVIIGIMGLVSGTIIGIAGIIISLLVK